MQTITIISNEKIHSLNNIFECDNVEIKNLIEGLQKYKTTKTICRVSNNSKSHTINANGIMLSSNIYSYLKNIYLDVKKNKAQYLIISITPYTFLSILFLKVFKKKFIIYLRSDGFKEYQKILGFLGTILYKIMFLFSVKNSNLISCGKKILRDKKGIVITPSTMNNEWNSNTKLATYEKIKLLYVGRFRVEKGIFSLIEIFKKLNDKIVLTMIGNDNKNEIKINDNRIYIKNIISNNKELIKEYDEHNIFILPSFTEGYSMVIDEALSRLRPVIIFEDIINIIGNRKGIFVCKREASSLLETISFISKNYKKIVLDIKKNTFSNKEKFIRDVYNSLSK